MRLFLIGFLVGVLVNTIWVYFFYKDSDFYAFGVHKLSLRVISSSLFGFLFLLFGYLRKYDQGRNMNRFSSKRAPIISRILMVISFIIALLFGIQYLLSLAGYFDFAYESKRIYLILWISFFLAAYILKYLLKSCGDNGLIK